MTPTTTKKKPRISLNKLGEFVYATHARQREITRDLADPKQKGFKRNRYKEAKAAIGNYFVSGFDATILDRFIERLNKKLIKNEHQLNDRKVSIESLNIIRNIDVSIFNGFTFRRFLEDSEIDIAGVDVNAFPDLIFQGVVKKQKIIGAVKFHIGKTQPLKDEAQIAVATILNQFIDSHVKTDDEKALPSYTFSIDIFKESIQCAPKAQAKIMNNVVSALENYILIWNSVITP